MDTLKNEICEAFNTSLGIVVKQSYRGGPSFTVNVILDRVLKPNFTSLDLAFPEISSRSTITTMLQKIFTGKTLRAQHWNTYILEKVNKRKCSNCLAILLKTEFYGNECICILCDSNRHKKDYLENSEKILARNTEWKKNNPDKILKQAQDYYQEHKAEAVARTIKRTLQVELATPQWADLNKMNLIYNNREQGEHVDHIVPLQHDLVCGLHNEFNLQYLLAADNISKSNKFDPETYVHELP